MKAEKEWMIQFGSDDIDDAACAIAVDQFNGLYVVGFTQKNPDIQSPPSYGSKSVWLGKYDAGSGRQLWRTEIGSGGKDHPFAIAVDRSKGLYVAGSSNGVIPMAAEAQQGGFDSWVAKFDTEFGKQLWASQVGNSKSDTFTDIAISINGDLYVVGYTERENSNIPGGSYDTWLAKYDETSGTRRWLNRLGSQINTLASSIALDEEGGVYLAGTKGERIPNVELEEQDNRGIWLAKYDASLANPLWVTALDSEKGDYAGRIVLDGAGGLYLAGQTWGNLSGTTVENKGKADSLIAKYHADTGALLWTSQAGSKEHDLAAHIAVDNSGNLYVAGYTEGQMPGAATPNKGDFDTWFAKYDTDLGEQIWLMQVGSPQQDLSKGIAVDQLGHLYITGTTKGSLTSARTERKGDLDSWIAKYKQMPAAS